MSAARSIAILASLMASPSLHAAPLFEDSAIVKAVLEGPLAELMDDTEGRDQLPFTFRAEGAKYLIKVRLRGKSRLRVCDFRPLRLNFRKTRVGGTLFADQDKLKLVVPCHTSERAEKNLIEEYAVYRMLNLLTPVSYRVRLLQLTFADTAGDVEHIQTHTFLLEPDKHLAARLGGHKPNLEGVSLKWLNANHMALIYIFQYLIGNLDWSLVTAQDEKTCCHNGTLIETGETILYVPYDFDLSGFVNAPYATPPPYLHLRSVTQRRYRGFCTDRKYLEQALDTVVAKRPEIVAMIRSLPVISDKDKQRRIDYLDQFFRAAEDEDKLLGRFERRCID